MLLGQGATGHGDLQLRVVGRVRRDQVDGVVLETPDELQRVTDLEATTGGIEDAHAAGVRVAEVAQLDAGAVTLRGRGLHHLLVDLRPARFDLEAERAARGTGDGCSQQRPADAGEGVQHQLPALAEELDDARHQRGGLLAPCALRRAWPSSEG